MTHLILMLIFIWGFLIMSVLNLWHVLKQPHVAADISEVLGWAQMNDRCSFLHCLAFHNLSWLAYWGGCCSMRAQLLVCHTAHALLIITHSLYGCTLPAHSPFTSVLYAKELASLPTSVPMPFTNKAPLTKQANNHSSHDADHGKGPLGPETSSMILNPWWVRATLQMSITLAKARAKLSIGFFWPPIEPQWKKVSFVHWVIVFPQCSLGGEFHFYSCLVWREWGNTTQIIRSVFTSVCFLCMCVLLFVGCNNEWPQCPEIAISKRQCVARSLWEGWSDLCTSHKEKERGEFNGVGSRWKDKMSLCDPEIKGGKGNSRFEMWRCCLPHEYGFIISAVPEIHKHGKKAKKSWIFHPWQNSFRQKWT